MNDKQKLEEILKKVAEGNYPLIEPIREAAHLAFESGSEAALYVKGVESEIDGVPGVAQEPLWERAAYAEKRAEAEAYLASQREELIKNLRELQRELNS